MSKSYTRVVFFATVAATMTLASVNLEIPADSYLEHWPKESPVKMALYGSHPILSSSATSIKWGECPSKKVYDVATGVSQPDPPQVGSNVGLNLSILMNQQADIKGIYINVDLTPQGSTSPIVLYQQDFPATSPGTYSPGDEFSDSVSWLIPSFAPLGHYGVTITVHGADQKSDNFACLTADFDILP